MASMLHDEWPSTSTSTANGTADFHYSTPFHNGHVPTSSKERYSPRNALRNGVGASGMRNGHDVLADGGNLDGLAEDFASLILSQNQFNGHNTGQRNNNASRHSERQQWQEARVHYEVPPHSLPPQLRHPLYDQSVQYNYAPLVPPYLPIEIDGWNNAVSEWEQRNITQSKIGLLVSGRFEIQQRIDQGSYGQIFVAYDHCTMRKVAVKFDDATAGKNDHLKYEYETYCSILYDDGSGKPEGFPETYWYGQGFGHSILVLELLGAHIASLFTFCDRKFGWQTIYALGEQMIQRIKHIHKRGFIHRDIKPENFLMGLGAKENVLYLIDFGLARRYRFRTEGRNLKHIPFSKSKNFIGTAKYASLNSLRSAELSRRDDLESIAYVLIEMINGDLPWKNILRPRGNTPKRSMHQQMLRAKEQTDWTKVCPGMADFVRYCRELPFEAEPEYELLIDWLRRATVPPIAPYPDISIANVTCEVCRTRQTGSPHERQALHERQEQDVVSCNEALLARRQNAAANLTTEKSHASCSSVNLLAPEPTTTTGADDESDQASGISGYELKWKSENNGWIPSDTSDQSVTCHKCGERIRSYFDQETIASGGAQLSWHVWRRMNDDLRQLYDSRFSWAITPPIAHPNQWRNPNVVSPHPMPFVNPYSPPHGVFIPS